MTALSVLLTLLCLLQLGLATPLKRALSTTTGGTVLADGSYFQSGSITSTLRWQSSGILIQGGCVIPSTLTMRGATCYQMQLAASGNSESTTAPTRRDEDLSLEDLAAKYDDALDAYFEVFPEQVPATLLATSNGAAVAVPRTALNASTSAASDLRKRDTALDYRQRIEIFSWPGAVAGTKWYYSWTTYNTPTSSSAHFSHSWQILRRDGSGGPVVALDIKAGYIVISDTVRGCTACVQTPIRNWFNRGIVHHMTITYGVSGSISYNAYVQPVGGVLGAPVLSYTATGDMGSSASLKFGMYRLAVDPMNPQFANMGMFSATQLS